MLQNSRNRDSGWAFRTSRFCPLASYRDVYIKAVENCGDVQSRRTTTDFGFSWNRSKNEGTRRPAITLAIAMVANHPESIRREIERADEFDRAIAIDRSSTYVEPPRCRSSSSLMILIDVLAPDHFFIDRVQGRKSGKITNQLERSRTPRRDENDGSRDAFANFGTPETCRPNI